jgi:transcriptional regulator with XRE-family HTH domain
LIREKPRLALDQSKLNKLSDKEYRDAYLHDQVRSWIAYQFQALRRKFELSQKEMADRTGKTQSVISRLESTEYGKVSVQTLLDVASSLDVALVVQFVSYPEFLDRTRDKSERAMQPQTISESIASVKISIVQEKLQSPVLENTTFRGRESKDSVFDSMRQRQVGLPMQRQTRSALSHPSTGVQQ